MSDKSPSPDTPRVNAVAPVDAFVTDSDQWAVSKTDYDCLLDVALQLERELVAARCGCIETYPQLVPGTVSHGNGCDAYIGLKGATDALLRDADRRIAEREAQLDAIAQVLDLPKESWRIAGCDVLAHQVHDLMRNYIELRSRSLATTAPAERRSED